MTGMLVFAMVQWGFLTAVIARGKRRDPALWFLFGAALPVLGILVALAVDTPRRRVRATPSRPAPRRQPAIAAIA